MSFRYPSRFSRRAILMVAAVLLAAAGCRRGIERPSTAELIARFNGLKDDPAKHLRIDYQGSPYAEGGQPGSWIQRQIEQKFNVSLHVNFIPIFSYDKLLSFRLIGGDIPDVYWLRDAREMKKAVEQGFALEVPYEVIVHHAPDYLRLLQGISPDAWLLSHADNRNYGLPTFNTTQATYPYPGVWNKTWLERVGIRKVPETLAEMEEALRRFRHNDPDGDGKMDTYGMCPWKPGIAAGSLDRSFEEIYGAFGVIGNGWMVREGQVVWGGTVPEIKSALALLRRWYADGLIHPDYMTLPVGNLAVRQQLFSGSVGYIVGFNLNGWNYFDKRIPSSLSVLHAAIHPGEELAPAWLPRGPAGHRGMRTWGGSIGGIMVFGPQLAKSPEKLVRLLRVFNEIARDPELYRDVRFGKEGLHWRWDERFGITKLPPYDKRANSSRELLGENILSGVGDSYGYFAPFSPPAVLIERYMPAVEKEFRATYQKPEWGLKDVLLMAETVPSASKYFVNLVQLQAIAYTEIITGKKPVESFDEFVAAWHAQGGAVLTREANELYLRKQAIRDNITRLMSGPTPTP